MVVVGGIRLDHRHHRVRIHESDRVVDVSVGVVAHDALVDPENLVDTVVSDQILLDLPLREMGIAIGIQQA